MMKGRVQSFILVLSVICAVWAVASNGNTLLAREGAFAAAVGFWFIRLEMRRGMRSKPETAIACIITLLGLILWRLGSIRPESQYVWGVEAARTGMLYVLAQSLGLLAIPSLLAMYLLTPVKPAVKQQSTMRRPAGTGTSEYRIAV